MAEPGNTELSEKQNESLIKEKPPEDELKKIREFAEQKFNINPENATTLDDILVSQLRANLRRRDAEDFVELIPDGQTVYGLPFEVREWQEKFQVFVPDVAEWYYLRRLPVRGNHPPFDETYAIGVSSPFNKAFERITDIKPRNFSDQNPPVVFGQPTDPGRTPFGRLNVTSDSILLELQCEPTLYQVQKIEELQKRFLERGVYIGTSVNKDNKIEQIQPLSSSVKEKPLPNVNVSRDVNTFLGGRHLVSITEDGKIDVKTLANVDKPKTFMFGFGYFPYQLERANFEENSIMVGFYFDTNGSVHDDAKGAFVLDKIASNRWHLRENKEIDFYQIKKDLEDETKDKEVVLSDTWPYRKEVINDGLPFILSVEGYKIPCGLRAMVDFEKSTLQVELITDKKSCFDPVKKVLLDRVIKQIGKRLGQEMEVELEVMKRSERYKDIVKKSELTVSINVFNYA